MAEYMLSQATVYGTLFLFHAFIFIKGDGSSVGKLYMFLRFNTSVLANLKGIGRKQRDLKFVTLTA
jgi:hypothetical protein